MTILSRLPLTVIKLSQIEAVEGPESLYLRIVPRVDLPKELDATKGKEDRNADSVSNKEKAAATKRKKSVVARGPQKLFNPNDHDRRAVMRADSGGYVVGRDTYSSDGGRSGDGNVNEAMTRVSIKTRAQTAQCLPGVYNQQITYIHALLLYT